MGELDLFCPSCHNYNLRVSTERPFCTHCGADIWTMRGFSSQAIPQIIICAQCRATFTPFVRVGAGEFEPNPMYPRGEFCPACGGRLHKQDEE